jgi:hypothetical protein
MKYEHQSRRRIRASGVDPDDVSRVLERVESSVPHLHFDEWRAGPATDSQVPDATVSWLGNDNRRLRVRLALRHLELTSACRRLVGVIRREQPRFLSAVAREAAYAIAASRGTALSLADFGTGAVAEEIQARAQTVVSALPILQFVRSLGQETYENQRLSYGLILAPIDQGGASLADAFDNKRFKRITDGFSTAIVLDRQARIRELVALTVPANEGIARQRRPWWGAGLAEAARQRSGVGIALTRNGDMLVVHQGRLAFTQRGGRWSEWDHSAILGHLRKLWLVTGNPRQLRDVLSYFYHLALDLAFRRSGGLLVVTQSQARVARLLASRIDLLGSSRRDPPEQALDRHIAERAIYRMDRRVVADLASLDGALIADRTGRLWAYGAMTKASRSAQQGARTRAAVAASQDGVAIKVSSDGDISFFRRGTLRFEI